MNSIAEKWAQKVLEAGFVVSLTAVSIGFILYIVEIPSSTNFLRIGFWALLSTPTLRVLTLMFAFFRQKEKKFAWAAVGVLLVLTVSFLIEQL